MSDSNVSITSEVNVLKAFAKVQGSPLGPKLLDVDDWENKGQKIHFYVMEYIQGTDLLSFIQSKGIFLDRCTRCSTPDRSGANS